MMYFGLAVVSFISAGTFYFLFRNMGDGEEEEGYENVGEGKVDDDDDDEEDP
jgi:hypothetical protein